MLKVRDFMGAIATGLLAHEGRVPVHRGIAMGMVVFGVGVIVNPGFPFQGDLEAIHPLLPILYGVVFMAGGFVLAQERPRPLTYLALTVPLFFHLTVNIVDITLTALDRLLPVVALYGLLLFFLVKAYRQREEVG